MFRSILASITLYSIVFLSIGQIAFALPSKSPAEENSRAEVKNGTVCSVSQSNPSNQYATLGRQTQNKELLPISHSQTAGFQTEFISSSTGELSFAQIDIAFKDNPLLVFQRTYVSGRNEDFGLGRGWSFAFNDSIILSDDNAVLSTGTGDDFTYRRTGANRYALQTPDSTDVKEFNLENSNTISAENGDVIRIYKRTGGEYHLTRITAPDGFEVSINRKPRWQDTQHFRRVWRN